MRIGIGVLMILHGIAHLVGFAGAWRLSSSIPYKTTTLGGYVDLGAVGIRILGFVWLACALAFAATGLGTVLRASWWHSAAVFVTIVSLVLCVMELPAAKIGAVLDVVLLVVLLAGRRVWWT